MSRFSTFVRLAPVAIATVVMLVGCDDSDDDGGGSGTNNTAECCAVSEAPACTGFLIGGAKSLRPGGTCAPARSGDVPTGLTKKNDAKGCLYWELDESSPSRCVSSAADGG
jgi:hypothetical protein